MEKKIRISLIVSTYNRGEILLRTLNSITAQRLAPDLWEAVIVNNHSTDNTPQIIEQFLESDAPHLNIITVEEHSQGLSFARNRGIAETSGDIVVFIDDDEEINREFLGQYLEFFTNHLDAAAAGGVMEPLYEYETPRWLSPWVEKPLSSTIDLGPRIILFKGERYPIGGNMAFRREVLERHGGFNTSLGRTGKKLLGGEEKDLFTKIRKDGGKIYWVPGPRVLHIIPESRLTHHYFTRLTKSIGISERTRTLSASRGKYGSRLFLEAFKWGGTFVLAGKYILEGQPAKARYVILMRKNITAGLLGMVRELP